MKIETDLTMREYDPADFPDYGEADEPVCAKCFSDEDISQCIEEFNGPPGCSFCSACDAPTAPLDYVAEHMRECLLQFYGFAVEQLPYETREGGYQGAHWDTYDLIFDQLGLDLPRDRDDRLRYVLPDRITVEVWCDYDWLSLDYDEELNYEWKKFARKYSMNDASSLPSRRRKRQERRKTGYETARNSHRSECCTKSSNSQKILTWCRPCRPVRHSSALALVRPMGIIKLRRN
jgi:hypothetical protein